ncbi:MAG: hypothetical protein WC705_01780 [Candidatus Paceibacterota bacterium]|jgi:hypothetical protein
MKKIAFLTAFLVLGVILVSGVAKAESTDGVVTVVSQEEVLTPELSQILKDGLDALEITLNQVKARLDSQLISEEKKPIVDQSLVIIKNSLVTIDYTLETLSLAPSADSSVASDVNLSPIVINPAENQETSNVASKDNLLTGTVSNKTTLTVVGAIVGLALIGLIMWFIMRKPKSKTLQTVQTHQTQESSDIPKQA